MLCDVESEIRTLYAIISWFKSRVMIYENLQISSLFQLCAGTNIRPSSLILYLE